MRMIVGTAAAILLAASIVSAASAGPATGTTTLLGPASANSPVDVRVSLASESPVVPFEYSIVNQCWFSGRYAGHYDSYERFDLIGPWFEGAGGAAETTVTISLQPVPAGAACAVSIVKGNTVVKGSTTQYSVGP